MYNTSAEPTKSKATAAVLAGLLGLFGAHRFYLRRVGSAVTQLILGGICLIVGLICVSSSLEERTYYLYYYYTETVVIDEGLLAFGIVQLCVSVCISVWVLVDFIRILTGSLLPADGSLYIGQKPRTQTAYQSRIAVPYKSNPDYTHSSSDGYVSLDDAPKERLSAESEGGIAKTASQGDDAIAKLERLAKLRDGGYITEEEFNQKKQEILDRM